MTGSKMLGTGDSNNGTQSKVQICVLCYARVTECYENSLYDDIESDKQ